MMLSDSEKQKELRFRFASDQRCYLITRALQRTVLSHYAAVDPKHWCFVPNAYGKPEISNTYGARNRITFNLSHTDGLIIMGVSSDTAIGVDAEHVRAPRAPLDMADGFFAADEVAALRRLPIEQQNERFFCYWTLKEAYIKACSMGLSVSLDKFSFDLSVDSQVDVAFRPPLTDNRNNWQFTQFWMSTDHLAAVCSERDGQLNCRDEVAVRLSIPLHGETMLTYPVIRQSFQPE